MKFRLDLKEIGVQKCTNDHLKFSSQINKIKVIFLRGGGGG